MKSFKEGLEEYISKNSHRKYIHLRYKKDFRTNYFGYFNLNYNTMFYSEDYPDLKNVFIGREIYNIIFKRDSFLAVESILQNFRKQGIIFNTKDRQ